MASQTTDRIEKQVVVPAPRERVWRALTDAREFGAWFGVALEGDFASGRLIEGKMTYPGYEGMPFEIEVDRIEPQHLFSFRWHPFAIEPDADYSTEPMTLVVFELRDQAEGTLITVVESGFDSIPIERRRKAFESNSEGWELQMTAIRDYVAASP